MLAEIPLPFRSAVSDSEEGKKEEKTAEKKQNCMKKIRDKVTGGQEEIKSRKTVKRWKN